MDENCWEGQPERSLSNSPDKIAELPQRETVSPWYSDWQNLLHAQVYDSRSGLSNGALVRNLESFNETRLLNEHLANHPSGTLLEVGCATGELYRYLKIRHPRVSYIGVDISRPAIARAQQKYPEARFFLADPRRALRETWGSLGVAQPPEVVYSRDVLHHQTDPFGFFTQLLGLATQALILRTRTRDQGETVTDPEMSCQYHYDGWMPYIVINLQELIDQARKQVPQGELVIYRDHRILGGRENRFLPRECYLPDTGTAETAAAVFLKGNHPGRVRLEDRKEIGPPCSAGAKLKSAARQIWGAIQGGGSL